MKQQRASRLRKRQVPHLVQNNKVHVHQTVSQLAVFALRLLKLQRIHKLHR